MELYQQQLIDTPVPSERYVRSILDQEREVQEERVGSGCSKRVIVTNRDYANTLLNEKVENTTES